jgi:hypothetical protein
MKIKNTHEGALINPAVAAEIEALHMEIKDLKTSLQLTIEVLNDTVWALRSIREQRLMNADRLTR